MGFKFLTPQELSTGTYAEPYCCVSGHMSIVKIGNEVSARYWLLYYASHETRLADRQPVDKKENLITVPFEQIKAGQLWDLIYAQEKSGLENIADC